MHQIISVMHSCPFLPADFWSFWTPSYSWRSLQYFWVSQELYYLVAKLVINLDRCMAFLYFNISTNIYMHIYFNIFISNYTQLFKGIGQLFPICKTLTLSKGLMSVFAAFLYSTLEPLEIYSSLHVFRKVFFSMITVSMRLEEIKTGVAASSNVVFFFWLGTSATNFSQMLKFNQRNDLCSLQLWDWGLCCRYQEGHLFFPSAALYFPRWTVTTQQIASRLVMAPLRQTEVSSVITAHTTSVQAVPECSEDLLPFSHGPRLICNFLLLHPHCFWLLCHYRALQKDLL